MTYYSVQFYPRRNSCFIQNRVEKGSWLETIRRLWAFRIQYITHLLANYRDGNYLVEASTLVEWPHRLVRVAMAEDRQEGDCTTWQDPKRLLRFLFLWHGRFWIVAQLDIFQFTVMLPPIIVD